jgi:preprotein translocase subunit SecA
MKERVEDTVIRNLFRVEPVSQEQMVEQRRDRERRAASAARMVRPGPAGAAGTPGSGSGGPTRLTPNRPGPPPTVVRKGDKIGRNDPCPCGSGKKYKKCCGASPQAATG